MTIDRFFVTENVHVPLDRDARHEKCPHEKASKNLYPLVVERDIADIEVRNGGSYCWNSCRLTDCPSYKK
jgi:hypothetical protein